MSMSRLRSLLIPLVVALVPACGALKRAPRYGGKPVEIVLTTAEQEREGLQPVEAGAAVQGADAYLLTVDQWIELDGAALTTDIERKLLERDEAAVAAAVKRLLHVIAPYKCPKPTRVEVLVSPRRYVFVAFKAGRVRHVEVDPVRAPKAVVSFE
jgi:hypothetical protein